MQWIGMALPSFISIFLLEILLKKDYTWLQFVKRLGMFILINNLLSIIVCYFIFNISTPMDQNFMSVSFFIKYTLLNIVFSIILPIILLTLSPYLSISIEKRGQGNGK